MLVNRIDNNMLKTEQTCHGPLRAHKNANVVQTELEFNTSELVSNIL